ncbi:MAG: 8-oxo-dGTP diphosphatase [Clostridia bacterium]|nr:8-oxo-dGTP diphosphatase [Clostridia bacterium]
MPKTEEVELTNMCMICDGKGNVLVQDKVGNSAWHGWNFPGGHVEKGEYITPSVIREVREETGLTIEAPRLCGIKEFHKEKDGKRFIVFLYTAGQFSGELKSSEEGTVFWYPLAKLQQSGKLADGFEEMLPVFTTPEISEIFYITNDDLCDTVLC